MRKKSICIAGKNDIAVDILSYLLEQGVDKDEIVVTCNRNETGKDSWQKSLRYCAKEKGVEEASLKEIYDLPDVFFVSLEYDRIICPEKFSTSKLFNMHFSLLPKYKGCYPSLLPILHGEKESGVTFHRMDHGIDTGEIIEQEHIVIEDNDTGRDLYLRCIETGTDLGKKMLKKHFIEMVPIISTPQNSNEASYYSRNALDFSNLQIDLNKTASEIRNQIRAFYFPEYQIPMIYGKEIKKAKIRDERSINPPGTVISKEKTYMVLSTIDYDLELYYEVP